MAGETRLSTCLPVGGLSLREVGDVVIGTLYGVGHGKLESAHVEFLLWGEVVVMWLLLFLFIYIFILLHFNKLVWVLDDFFAFYCN